MIFKDIKIKSGGFTLIELMVATTLFTIVMLMGVGSLVVSSNSAKSSQALQTAVDNVNFAMESMSRELRMGTYYDCGQVNLNNSTEVHDCPEGGEVIGFTPQLPSTLLKVSFNKYPRTDGKTHGIQRCETGMTAGSCPDIVSSNVDIKDLKFFVVGADASTTNIQPSVEITLKGEITVKGITTSFALQTMASQRSAEE